MSAGMIWLTAGALFAVVYGAWPDRKPARLPPSEPVQRLVDVPRPAQVTAPIPAPIFAPVPLPQPRPPIAAQKREFPKAETVLTAAAIASLIVQASREAYYATGRPCACPDDSTRNGRRCGGNSAYSRPGGAAPLCYPSDVPTTMIEAYRARTAATASNR